jgi:hypothetical protein
MISHNKLNRRRLACTFTPEVYEASLLEEPVLPLKTLTNLLLVIK